MSDDNKIEELEEQLSEQQKIIEGLSEKVVELSGVLPDSDRRAFLKTGAGAGALLAAGAIGRASAAPGDDGDTVWGADANRDDYYVDELDANSVSTGAIDTGRTWQDVTASRSFGTTETNSTDTEIVVIASAAADADGTNIGLQPEVDGVTISRDTPVLDSGNYVSAPAFAVGPGESYRVVDFRDTADFSMYAWVEYRP